MEADVGRLVYMVIHDRFLLLLRINKEAQKGGSLEGDCSCFESHVDLQGTRPAEFGSMGSLCSSQFLKPHGPIAAIRAEMMQPRELQHEGPVFFC